MSIKNYLVLVVVSAFIGCSTVSRIENKDGKFTKDDFTNKSLYVLLADFELEDANIDKVEIFTINFLDSERHPFIFDHEFQVASANSENPKKMKGCYLIAADQKLYAVYRVNIHSSKGTIATKFGDEKTKSSMFFDQYRTPNPYFVGSLIYSKGKLTSSKEGFDECKTILEKEFPTLTFVKPETKPKK
ncbi:hypothetical protein P3G55_16980 [Leptospira sp. 96542]|nr:hypothetical protein [Leptospira sp. 96542]